MSKILDRLDEEDDKPYKNALDGVKLLNVRTTLCRCGVRIPAFRHLCHFCTRTEVLNAEQASR